VTSVFWSCNPVFYFNGNFVLVSWLHNLFLSSLMRQIWAIFVWIEWALLDVAASVAGVLVIFILVQLQSLALAPLPSVLQRSIPFCSGMCVFEFFRVCVGVGLFLAGLFLPLDLFIVCRLLRFQFASRVHRAVTHLGFSGCRCDITALNKDN
jgi:hypothetical protein